MEVSERTNQSLAGRANRMLDMYPSREMPELESLEEQNDGSPAWDESKLTDHDGKHKPSITPNKQESFQTLN